jgi:enoyl-[acyl-carrier protein] reductase III
MAQEKKAALVTGASRGIGRATAVALAKANLDVAINYSRSEEAACETGGDTHVHKIGQAVRFPSLSAGRD